MHKPLNSRLGRYYKEHKIYLWAFASSLASALGMFFLLSVFSRFFSEKEFLNFVVDIRISGFMIAFVSFGLGFSIIKNGEGRSIHKEIFPASIYLVSFLAFLVSFPFVIFFGLSFYVCFWILAGSLFHVYISTVRVSGNHHASLITFIAKFLFVIGSGILVVNFQGDGDSYFILYSVVLLTWILFDSLARGFSFRLSLDTVSLGRSLVGSSWTRAVDNLLRSSFHFIPIISTEYFLGTKEAGLISLAILSIKVFESTFQPVVMQIHVNSIKSLSDIIENPFNPRFLISFALTFVLFLCSLFFGQYLIAVWLGSGYEPLIELIGVTIWALPVMLSLQYYRGVFESRFISSPFVGINFFSLSLFSLFLYLFPLSLFEVSLLYVGVFWLRFSLFLLIKFKLL